MVADSCLLLTRINESFGDVFWGPHVRHFSVFITFVVPDFACTSINDMPLFLIWPRFLKLFEDSRKPMLMYRTYELLSAKTASKIHTLAHSKLKHNFYVILMYT